MFARSRRGQGEVKARSKRGRRMYVYRIVSYRIISYRRVASHFLKKAEIFLVFQLFTSRRRVVESWNLKCQGPFSMENLIFNVLFFQICEKKMKSRKIVTFATSYIFFWWDVSPFWAKRPRLFSFLTFYPSPKGRRELEIKTPGVIFHGESDFRWIIISNFWNKSKVGKSQVMAKKPPKYFPLPQWGQLKKRPKYFPLPLWGQLNKCPVAFSRVQ